MNRAVVYLLLEDIIVGEAGTTVFSCSYVHNIESFRIGFGDH